jgi:hypothetical protein
MAVGPAAIFQHELALAADLLPALAAHPNLRLLGPSPAQTPRLPIVSFLVVHPESGLYLHYNFVCAILNDFFGIQTRGGCACAGPYAQDLLGLDPVLADAYGALLREDDRLDRIHLRRVGEYSDRELLRPGFSRFNFPYFEDKDTLNFIIRAVLFVAEHGWKLLPWVRHTLFRRTYLLILMRGFLWKVYCKCRNRGMAASQPYATERAAVARAYYVSKVRGGHLMLTQAASFFFVPKPSTLAAAKYL